MLYPELPFLERFQAAAQDGFRAVEYLFPYAFDGAEIAARLKANGLQQVLFNAPPGDWDGGERGLACLPLGKIGHIQIASVPDRHEPDGGELNYAYLFALLDELSYGGWVGCEYRPARAAQAAGTSAGLGWLKPWL